jgi:hypothetical protein
VRNVVVKISLLKKLAVFLPLCFLASAQIRNSLCSKNVASSARPMSAACGRHKGGIEGRRACASSIRIASALGLKLHRLALSLKELYEFETEKETATGQQIPSSLLRIRCLFVSQALRRIECRTVVGSSTGALVHIRCGVRHCSSIIAARRCLRGRRDTLLRHGEPDHGGDFLWLR